MQLVKQPSEEWKQKVDDLMMLIEQMYGKIMVMQRGISELTRASAKKIRRAAG